MYSKAFRRGMKGGQVSGSQWRPADCRCGVVVGMVDCGADHCGIGHVAGDPRCAPANADVASADITANICLRGRGGHQ